MKLNLTKPLCTFDLETTGTDIVTDKIVQIAIVKLFPDGKEEEYEFLINPEKVIPKAATDVHRITNDMVATKPTFKEMAAQLHAIFDGCDLAGYNVNTFDIPILATEFSEAGINYPPVNVRVFDAMVIFHEKNKRNLAAAYNKYTGKEMGEDAHDALVDTRATFEVMMGQLEAHDDIGLDMDALNNFCMKGNKRVDWAGKLALNEAGEVVFTFGKHKDKSVMLDSQTKGYATWMQGSNFPKQTKQILTEVLMGGYSPPVAEVVPVEEAAPTEEELEDLPF